MWHRHHLWRIFRCLVVFVVLIDVAYVPLAYLIHKLVYLNQVSEPSTTLSYDALFSMYENNGKTTVHHPRTMLFWTKNWGNTRWFQAADTLGPAHFRDAYQCPEYRCILTNQRNFLPSVDLFDVVLFHTAEQLPQVDPVPLIRNAKQLYVFANKEAPGETRYSFSNQDRSFYNITMTYRLDSDIIWAYFYIVDIASGYEVAPAQHPNWRQPPKMWNDTDVWEVWSGKTKLVAWFVSHCKTFSRREDFVANLRQHIPVDIFGKCGNMSCERYSWKCDEMLDREYKFYLAFENSLCIDYVTEKAFNQLDRLTIPVVLGGANYTRFLPPHSYIDAESFDNIESLAKFLMQLANNPVEYMSYFWYRSHYKTAFRSGYCDLCAYINRPNAGYRTQLYTDVEKWWYENSCRTNFKINV